MGSNGLPGSERKEVRLNGSSGSVFEDVKLCPPDAIFNVKESYLADKSPNKVNLGVGGEIHVQVTAQRQIMASLHNLLPS